MIQVEDLSLAYSGDPVLEDVSFTINRGERCGLVGRNGSGKTTLFRMLVGQEKPDKGTISFSKGYRLGYLDQHIRFTMPTVLEEACLGLKEDDRTSYYKAEKILFGLGITEEQLDLPPTQLSGGYSLRLHLTKVLLSEPDCLLLDEPTNYLDILSIRFLTEQLRDWEGEMVLISHDREFMDSITTHTMGIHRKQVRKVKGSTIDFYSQLVQAEEIHEKTRINLEKKREHLQSYIDRFGAKASKATQAQSKQKMLNRIPALEELRNLYNLDFSFREEPFHGKKLLEAKGVDFAYEENKPLIQDLSLEIFAKERIAIIGKNGYGKSTLLRLLAGDLNPNSGEIKISEQAKIGYFGQTHIQRLTENRTIEEEIASANPNMPFSEVRRIAGLMMFSKDRAQKKISVLSGGEKSRVLLGKILARPCNLLLLDEPTHHLDMESIEALIDALEDFTGSVVIVTHSELILKRLQLHKLVACHFARQEFFLGDYDEFLEKRGWEEESDEKKPEPKPALKPKEPDRIKVLESEIKKLEKTIQELEKKQEEDTLLMANAVQKLDTPKIQELVKRGKLTEKELESLYERYLVSSEELKKLKEKS